MSTSSNDPNAPDSRPELNSAEQPPAEKTTKSGTIGRAALPYLAALAAASAAPVSAAVPAAEPDRAYLEALLHGSWTQPPDLTARRLPSGTEAAQLPGEPDTIEQGFNDTWNPRPTPYSDRTYADSGFGDRTR